MSSTEPVERPLPVPDERSAPFWDAAAQRELRLPRCATCSRFAVTPELVCPNCSSTEPRWSFDEVSGRASVRSWTVVRQAFLPGIEAPYVLVDAELAEQPELRLVARLIDGPDADLALGAEVRVDFEVVNDDVSLPVFRVEPTR